MEHREVRCATCGYLGLRRFSDGAWMEVNDTVRTQGRTVSYKHARPIPECYKKAFNLPEEVREAVAQRLKSQNIPAEIVALHLEQPTTEDLLSVIGRNRVCGSYTDWIRGRNPPQTEALSA